MEAPSIDLLLSAGNLSPELKRIAEKVRDNERITFDEGVLLFEQGELGYLGALADHLRPTRHGDKT